MRRLMPYLTLIRKEWRDTRALTIASALLVPVAVLAMNEGFLDWRGDVGAWFVPVAVALYLIVIASDLVAADVASGRAQSYAALPVRASTLWASKLAFLVVAAVGFASWTLAVTSGLYSAFAPQAALDDYMTVLARTPTLGLLIGVAVVATVMFWSTILERGMAVVGAALVTGAVLGGTMPLIAWYDRELLPSDDAIRVCAAGLPVIFLAGSLFAFAKGPHHASSVLRRLAIAAIVPLCVLVPAGAVSAAVLFERLDVQPGDPDVRVAAGHVSPNGRYLAILATKQHKHARVRTWILDLEDGSIAQLPQRGLQSDWYEPWSSDGSYVAWTTTKRSWDLRREYDPETGEIIRTRSADQVNATRTYPFVPWATTQRGGTEVVITMQETGHEVRVPARSYPSYSKLPGFVIHRDTDGVHLHDLREGTSTVLQEGDNLAAHFSPRGEYVQVWDEGEQSIYSTRTGERMPVPTDIQVGWPGGSGTDHYALRFSQKKPTLLVDLRTGGTSELSPDPDSASGGWADVRVLPGGDRVLRVRRDGQVIAHDLDGGHRKTVFDPHRRSE